MPPRNPSEFQRLLEERDELLHEFHSARLIPLPKAQREGLLRQIREIERILEIEPTPYNS